MSAISQKGLLSSLDKEVNLACLIFSPQLKKTNWGVQDHFWVNLGCFFPFQSFKSIIHVCMDVNITYWPLFTLYLVFKSKTALTCTYFSQNEICWVLGWFAMEGVSAYIKKRIYEIFNLSCSLFKFNFTMIDNNK